MKPTGMACTPITVPRDIADNANESSRLVAASFPCICRHAVWFPILLLCSDSVPFVSGSQTVPDSGAVVADSGLVADAGFVADSGGSASDPLVTDSVSDRGDTSHRRLSVRETLGAVERSPQSLPHLRYVFPKN